MVFTLGVTSRRGSLSADGKAKHQRSGRWFHESVIVLLLLLIFLLGALSAYLYIAYSGQSTSLIELQNQYVSAKNQLVVATDQALSLNSSLAEAQASLSQVQNTIDSLQLKLGDLQGLLASDNVTIGQLQYTVANYSNTIAALQTQNANLSSNLNMQNVQVVVPRASFNINQGSTMSFKVVPRYSGKLEITITAPASFQLAINTTSLDGPIYNETIGAGVYTFYFPVIGTPAGAYAYNVYLTCRSPNPGTYPYAVNISVYN